MNADTQYRATRHDAPIQRDLPDKHRVGFARGALLFAAMSIFLGACADSPTAASDSSWHASASVSSAAPSDAVRITRAIAYAMRDASIRKAVQTAMRSSLVNEHKLVLQDYLKTQKGAKLFSATAAALDVSPQTLTELLANLPKLDFYLPFKAHRLTWKPASDVYVATTFDPDAATLAAYGTNGQTISLERSQGAPSVALIILHPAEPKMLRDSPQADAPGDVVQDPNDGDLATTAASASSVLAPSFTIEPGGGGGGGGSGPAPGTYINHFNIQEGDGWFGDSEMRFHSYAIAGFREFVPNNNGDGYILIADDICPVGTYARDGVVEDQGYDGLFPISPTVYRGLYLTCHGRPAFYAINMVEDDGGLMQPDDDYGWRFYTYGGYPAGATYDTVYSYYGNTFPFHGDDPAFNRVAYLRITIY